MLFIRKNVLVKTQLKGRKGRHLLSKDSHLHKCTPQSLSQQSTQAPELLFPPGNLGGMVGEGTEATIKNESLFLVVVCAGSK